MLDECTCRQCDDAPPLAPNLSPPITGDGSGVALPDYVVKHFAESQHIAAVTYLVDGVPTRFERPRRTIIAFTGLASSGKSTAAKHLVARHGFTRVRFAGPLKAMMAALGLSDREIEGDLKERPCALLSGKTPRYAMQTIGTEWGRDIIDSDLWIRAWRAALDRLPFGAPVVVDDCRFPNEAEAVRAAGGASVRIVRPGAGAGVAGHSSETHALPSCMEITNDESVPVFLAKVETALRDISWALAGAAS